MPRKPIVAWPQPGEPREKMRFVVAGMAASIVGMFPRYLSHRQDKRDFAEARQS